MGQQPVSVKLIKLSKASRAMKAWIAMKGAQTHEAAGRGDLGTLCWFVSKIQQVCPYKSVRLLVSENEQNERWIGLFREMKYSLRQASSTPTFHNKNGFGELNVNIVDTTVKEMREAVLCLQKENFLGSTKSQRRNWKLEACW